MRRAAVAAMAVGLLSATTWPAEVAAQDDLYGGGAVSASRSASARGADPAEAPDLDVSLELGFGGMGYESLGATVSVFGVAPTLRGRFRMGEDWELQGAWSFPYGAWSRETVPSLLDDSDSKVTAGNPFVGGWYLAPMRRRLLRVGGGLAMPVAQVDTRAFLFDVDDVGFPSATTAVVLRTAMAMHGLYEAWLWLPQTLSIVLGADYQGEAGERLRASADAAVAVLVPSGDRSGDTELLLQWAAGIAYVAGAAQVGLRLLSAWLPNQEEFQLSLRPFFEYAMDEAFFRVAMHLNLDEPYGFSFEEGAYWGLLLTVGYRK